MQLGSPLIPELAAEAGRGFGSRARRYQFTLRAAQRPS